MERYYPSKRLFVTSATYHRMATLALESEERICSSSAVTKLPSSPTPLGEPRSGIMVN